jgi:type IX secretion system PorP/SprF family membrane protein
MRKIAFVLFTLCSLLCAGQDVHLSQFNNSPLNLNPALAGLFNGDYRFVANQRNQWSSIPVPYATYCLAADMRIPLKKNGDNLGAGIQINSDKAGDTRYKTLQASVSVSYIKKISSDSTMFISAGVQAGISNKAFVPAYATYDSQYDGTSYNAALPSNESYNASQITYPDLGAGLNWLWKMKDRTALNLGFSAWHLNKPPQSFFGDNTVRLDPKFTLHCKYSLKLNTNFDLSPAILVSWQGKSREFAFGGSARYLLAPEEGKNTAFHLGVFYRLADAPIAYAGIDYGNFNFGLSYDVNTSGLVAATNNRGGYEFSIIYIMQKFVPKKSNKSLCPVYL